MKANVCQEDRDEALSGKFKKGAPSGKQRKSIKPKIWNKPVFTAKLVWTEARGGTTSRSTGHALGVKKGIRRNPKAVLRVMNKYGLL